MAYGSVAAVALSPHEQKHLEACHPELKEAEDAVVISGPRALVSTLLRLAEQLTREGRQSERLLEALTLDLESHVLDEPRVLQLHRQAEAREHFLRTHATLSSADVAALAGSKAKNHAALASRWKKEGRIFALTIAGEARYPAFQFGEDGQPIAAVAEVIRHFEGESDWTLALWFSAGSGWLGDRTPADVLSEDPEAVAHAARESAAPLGV